MVEDRLVTELFFDSARFSEISKISKLLESNSIEYILMPPDDRNIPTHLIVETQDLPKVRSVLKTSGHTPVEKEVIIIKLDNKPGTMADAAKRISEKGINLVYAFSVTMSPKMSYVLLAASDNTAALKALKA